MSSHSSSHGVVALAFADEVIERPRLLESYACAFTDEDDVTLLVLAPDADEREVERTFGPLATAAGLDETGSPDVVVLAVPSDPETTAALAGSVQLVVSERPAPAPFSALPAASPATPADWLQLVRGHAAPPAVAAAPPGYCIKPGYRVREANAYFHDAPDGLVHQPDVYALAMHLAERSGARTIVDIGAGGGGKLAPFGDRFRIVALDHADNVDALSGAIPGHDVIDHDLEHGIPTFDPDLLRSSVVVSADVIEHLRAPDAYLAGMAEIARHAPFVLLSTPDRARARGIFDAGPPANPAHVREWSLEELSTLLTCTGFGPHLAGYTVNTDVHLRKSTSLVIGGTQAHPAGKAVSPVTVLAIVTAFNEADILGATIGYLRAQGVDVHVIDNWSTDGSFELASAIGRTDPGVTVERFPDRPSGAWEWGLLLDRVADVAAQGDHDWTIHHDADEVRATPWHGVGLVEGIGFVDALGYSALDFTVADFRPVSDGFGAGQDPQEFFRHFEFGRRPGHFVQVKAWKGRQRVALSAAGGHDAGFDGRTIFPLKFLTRHYPLRSVEQGRRKVFTDRAPRVPVAERAKGWNTHYDAVAGDETFAWDAHRLAAYDDHTFATEYLVERVSGIGIVRDLLPTPSAPAAPRDPPAPSSATAPTPPEGLDTEVPPVQTAALPTSSDTVAVAFFDDLLRQPELLPGFASAFSATDPITLLLYAPGVDPAELESRLMPLVAGTPIATDAGPEVVALAVPDDAETAAAVAAQSHVLYGAGGHGGPFARLPVAGLQDLLVRVRGEAPTAPPAPAATASRPLDASPAPIEGLRRDPVSGVLLSPWAGEEATYADGGEQYVHEVVSAASDTSVHSRDLADAIRDWPSLYHLSPYRSTLYDCLGLTRPVDVVELGAGCGATTRWLGERMRSVLAVEGSRARAAVVRERCADLDTVEVVVGNFADLDLRGRADLVTLVGVLEYSHLYSLRWPGDPARAAVETLELAHGALREEGLLLVAIENSMGLKYWNGAREDHSGRVHESIEGYPDLRTACAFNARQLERMVRAAGFSEAEMLLPFPDYKLPRVIVDADADAEGLGLHNWIDSLSADRGFGDREQHFSERLALREVVRAGLLRDLANSFLLLAYAGDPASVRERLGLERDWAARHYSLDRAPVFRKRTTLRAAAATVEIESLLESARGAVFGGARVEPHVRGDLLVYRVAELGQAPDAEHQLTILLAQLSDWLVERHGTGDEDADGVPLLAGPAIDAVWWNIVVDPETGAWNEIDAEWNLDCPHPIDYVLWRGVEHLPARLGGTPEQTEVVRSALGSALRLLHPQIDARRPTFEAWELSFQRAVLGSDDRQTPGPAALTAGFRCNVCGAEAPAPARLDRETPSCPACCSTPRFRSVVHALSLGLFGEAIPLPDFPDRPDLRGVGLSDWPGYAEPLAAKLGYTNTYLHREPRLDILDPDPALEGTLDFLVSSEVFEHVPPPARRALDAAYRLLRPGGLLVLTVPYGLEGETAEHFPELHDWSLVQQGGRHVLVNTTADGRRQELDDLVFHGGDGLTVEMRVWSLPSLQRDIAAAGFTEIMVMDDDVPEWGIAWANRCSRPILARKPRGAAARSQPSPTASAAPDVPDAVDVPRMKSDWDERAEENAHHYVASGHEQWEEAAFSESGRQSVVGTVTKDLPRLTGGRDPGSLAALEIGCGVGRMTEHLGAIFRCVHGVDVSGEMVRLARERLGRHGNLHFHETSGADVACLPSGSVDFAFSFIVFQHVPLRDAVVSTIRDVHRVLRPGSMFKFQVQGTQEPDYLRAPKDTWFGVTFTQAELDEVAAEIGFEVVDAAGAGTQYFWQWWRKPGSSAGEPGLVVVTAPVVAPPAGRVVIAAPAADPSRSPVT